MKTLPRVTRATHQQLQSPIIHPKNLVRAGNEGGDEFSAETIKLTLMTEKITELINQPVKVADLTCVELQLRRRSACDVPVG